MQSTTAADTTVQQSAEGVWPNSLTHSPANRNAPAPAPARLMVTSAQAAAAGGIGDAISEKGAPTVDQRGECAANRVTGGIAERRDDRVAADAKRTKAKSLRKFAATVEEQRCWHSALLHSPELSAAFSAIRGRTSARLRRGCLTEQRSQCTTDRRTDRQRGSIGIRASQIGRAGQMRWEQHTAALDIQCAIDRASSDGIGLGAGLSDEKCVPVRDHRNRLLCA